MIYAIVVMLILIADQAMKFWTTKNILLGAVGDECARLIPGFAHITNVHNYGAAFSILQNARWPLIVVTVIFVVAIIVLINREIIHTPFGRWTAVLVLAGAIGNCIDRILYGYVVDMFEFEFFSFPVFNIADIFITVAGILFCIHLLVHNEPEEVKAANEPEFMRRRREARQAKEAPYANIPKRGEHKTLEEEIGAFDPNDPFGELGFGDVIPEPSGTEEAAETEEAPAPAIEPDDEPVFEQTVEPAAESLPWDGKDELFDSFLFEPGAEDGFSWDAPEAKAEEPAPEKPVEPEKTPETPAPNDSSYSLDDILAEFGDL